MKSIFYNITSPSSHQCCKTMCYVYVLYHHIYQKSFSSSLFQMSSHGLYNSQLFVLENRKWVTAPSHLHLHNLVKYVVIIFLLQQSGHFVIKLLCCVGGQVKHLVDYQLEVYKSKLTTVENLGKLFPNSLRWLIYLYQLLVDNQLSIYFFQPIVYPMHLISRRTQQPDSAHFIRIIWWDIVFFVLTKTNEIHDEHTYI